MKTKNYSAGETVDVVINYDDDDILFDDILKFKVTGKVDDKGEVVIKNILKNKTLNLK